MYVNKRQENDFSLNKGISPKPVTSLLASSFGVRTPNDGKT